MDADGHIRLVRGGREGGIYYCTRTLSGCLTCTAAPQATPTGATQLGLTYYGCRRANEAPGCREERGRGLEEERIRAT